MDRWKSNPRGRAVPSGRATRLARLGRMAGGVARGAAAEGLRRVASGERPSLQSMLMTPANAARFADELARMRGAAMKLGQLISMETGALLPPELSDILARLRDSANPMPPRQLKEVLIANWGRDFLRRFADFDVRPIAAASIGQVHRARLLDGRELAVKVQYPGVRNSIDSDVANVASLIKLSGVVPPQIELEPLIEEAKRQLHDEADYQLEGAHLATFHELLFGDPAFVTPQLYEPLSTRDILAMSFVPGAPIEDAAGASQEERDRLVGALIDLLLREIFEFRLVQTDPNFANYRYDAATGKIALLDFGATRALPTAMVETFRSFLRAALSEDRAALADGALAMGFLDASASPAMRERVLDAVDIGLAPLRGPGAYDFGASDMVLRMRDIGLEFAREREFGPAPPIDTLFLQRKVAGLFLLAARLKARVAVRPKLDAYVAGADHAA